MTMDPSVASSGLVDRVKNIILKPQAEWDKIASEEADVGKLYTGYALPLILLSAICGFIGSTIIGTAYFKLPLITGLVAAVLQVVAGLIGLFVMAFVTNALAPNFGSQQDQGQAHKLAVYSMTAAYLAGVFAILPPLAALGIVGLYSFALLYIGLPRLMKTPEDKRTGYFVTIIVVCIVLGIVINAVLGTAALLSGGLNGVIPGAHIGAVQQQQQQAQGTVTMPGGGSVDLGELQKMAEAAQRGEALPAMDPARLQGYLPQTLPGGFTLTGTSNASAVGTSQAEGEYTSGTQTMRVTIVHTGPVGDLAGLSAMANVQQSHEDADGYTRTSTVDGRIYAEEMSRSGGSAKYAVVGHGIIISAEGAGGVSPDQARAAVESIGIQRLERELRT